MMYLFKHSLTSGVYRDVGDWSRHHWWRPSNGAFGWSRWFEMDWRPSCCNFLPVFLLGNIQHQGWASSVLKSQTSERAPGHSALPFSKTNALWNTRRKLWEYKQKVTCKCIGTSHGKFRSKVNSSLFPCYSVFLL